MNFRKPRRHFERVFSLDLAVFALKLAPPSLPRTPGASIFESETPVFRDFSRRRAINAPNVRHRKNIVKTNTKRTSELPRVDRKSNKNRFKSASDCVWPRERRCERLGSCPEASWSVSGVPRQAFWAAPGRSWLARNGPRSALGRHVGF